MGFSINHQVVKKKVLRNETNSNLMKNVKSIEVIRVKYEEEGKRFDIDRENGKWPP